MVRKKADTTEALINLVDEPIDKLYERKMNEAEEQLERLKDAGKRKPRVKKLTKREQQILELSNNTVLPDHYETIWTESQLHELCGWLSTCDTIAVDTETMGINPFVDEIVGISLYAPHKGVYIPLKHVTHEDKCLPKGLVAYHLRPILENENKKFILHNAKFDMHVLRIWMNIKITPYFDTMIAQDLLDENQSKALKDMATIYLKVGADRYATLFGNTTFDKIPIDMHPETRTGCLATYYAAKDTELTYKMYEFQMRALQNPNLKDILKLMFEVEMPFLKIVEEAEAHGVRVDEKFLREFGSNLREELEELRKKIWQYTGEINLNAPAQLAEALYVKLKLPKVNKQKPMCTDKRTLKRLRNEHEVIGLLLDFRAKAKLVQAFADKLPKKIVSGRIHTSFRTIGATTGRMSSSNPNLQQLPPAVRPAFLADPGRLLVSIDFSQQELRVLAHVSKDKTLLDIYRKGLDIHSKTAVGMWNRKHPERQVTYEQFEAVRGLIGVITDVDGNFDASRVNDERIQPLKDAGYTDVSEEALVQLVELGKQLEKTRKMAKIVNFGRPKELCRSKTPLKTVKATA